MPTPRDQKSLLKLAQLRKVTYYKFKSCDALKRLVHDILKDDFDINCKVTILPDSCSEPNVHLEDCTALHFLCYKSQDIDAFATLLERGADFTIKNSIGQTPLHLLITHRLDIITESDGPLMSLDYIEKNDIPLIDAVMSAHVKFQNTVNPRDNDGVSHLHGACISNHVEALELLLKSGASVDEAVNFDAPKFAGYTPLHFAVGFHSFEVAQILVNRGANVNAKDAKGLTPLDVLVNRRLREINYYTSHLSYEDDDHMEICQKVISHNEKVVKLFFEKQCNSTTNIPTFHIACTLKDLTFAESLLDEVADINHAVPMHSPVRPGETSLHFAAENSIEAVKILLMRGAKMDVENAQGRTPLDVCVDKYSLEDICNVLSCDERWNVCMTNRKDRKTDTTVKLLDFVRATTDLDQFKLFFNDSFKKLSVPSDSSTMPGSTMLHLAVIFSEKKKSRRNQPTIYNDAIVRECLAKGLNVNAQNARGQTPLHLAFRLGKFNIVELLLERVDEARKVANLVDEDNLSYLHIAAAADQVENLIKKLLRSSKPNLAYKGKSTLIGIIERGYTPLHMATASEVHATADFLLKRGANLHATGANGVAPIHLLLKTICFNNRQLADVMFKWLLKDMQDRVVDGIGLSYLHAACYYGRVDVAEKLLDLGSDVNAVVSYGNTLSKRAYLSGTLTHLVKYYKCTPLQISDFSRSPEMAELLVRRGADIFATVCDRLYVPSMSYNNIEKISGVPLDERDFTRCFTSLLWERHDLQKFMEDRWGITRLHVACHIKNEEAVRSVLLDDGIEVNARVSSNSEIFAGCTPLHVLLTASGWRIENNVRSLTYDVESTMRLLLDRGADVTVANTKKDTPVHVLSKHLGSFANVDRCKYMLLNAQSDFSVNPVNAVRLSHFHLACHWHQVEAVEKFLRNGTVDVNQTMDYFARFRAGWTPLHMTLHGQMEHDDDWAKLLQTVDLLLKHGADVAAEDVHGDAPLYFALKHVPGLKTLDKLMRHEADIKSKNVECETLFDHQSDSKVSDYTSILKKYGYEFNSWNNLTGEGYIEKIFIRRNTNLAECKEFENLIHTSDALIVDELGRTVIHNSVAVLPAGFHNEYIENCIYAIESFIEQGVDIDRQDQSGQTAFHYAARMENRQGIMALLKCGADINVADNNGKLAFSYVMKYSKRDSVDASTFVKKVMDILNLHVKKLLYLGLEVNQLYKNIFANLQLNPSTAFANEVEVTKTMNVGFGSLTLFDFLMETGGVTLYPYLTIPERNIINDFFKSISREEFSELIGIIELQFRKMTARLELIDPALRSIRTLLGFSVPGLCEEITMYLTNSDLKNIVDGTVYIEKKEFVENTCN